MFNVYISIANSLYIILEYCMFGRLKDYLQSCDNTLAELGLPVELGDNLNSPVFAKGSSTSTDYVNILQSGSSSSYVKLLMRKFSLLSAQSDSVFSENTIAYSSESVDSDYRPINHAESLITLSRDYTNSPGALYNEDITNFALQIAYGLQHLEELKVYLHVCSSVCMNV